MDTNGIMFGFNMSQGHTLLDIFHFLPMWNAAPNKTMTKGGMQLVKNQWQGSGQLKWIKVFKEKHLYTKVQADGTVTIYWFLEVLY